MINNNKHLDDLFAAAWQEEPILSRENAEDLLRESNHMQLPSTLLSTKGAIMTSIGLSLAAVTAYVLLNGSPTPNPAPPSNSTQPQAANLFAHQQTSTTDEPKKNEPVKSKLIVVKNGEAVPTPPEPPQPTLAIPAPVSPKPPILVTPPMKVAGITAVTVVPEKLAKMGISKREDGTVDFAQKNDNGKVFSMGFPKNSWGIIISDDKPNTNINAPNFAPVIVTDSKGNKRLMQFSSEKNGIKTRTMELNSHGSANGMNNTVSVRKMQVGGKDGDVDKLTIGNPESNDRGNHAQQIHIESNVETVTETTGDGQSSSLPETNQKNVTVKTERKQIDTTINGKPAKIIVMHVNKTIRKDSTGGTSLDNGARSVNEAEIQFAQIDKQMQEMNLDSVIRTATKTMEIAMEQSNKQVAGINKKMRHNNMDSVLQLANEALKEATKSMEDINGNLNNLIPILVREKTSEHYNDKDGITYDDGLIFWYENTDALQEAVRDQNAPKPGSVQFTIDAPIDNNNEKPASLDVKSLGSVMSKSLLYPNPAKTTTTVRFTLSEPRILAFSIHDLLGKRVMEGGNLAANSAGSFEKELNLNELPSGVYLLVITTDKGEQSMQRLVIEK